MSAARRLAGGVVIDGTGSDPARRDIAIDGGRIVDDDPSGGEVVDLDGLTVLPGLIDAHSHLGVITDQDVSPAFVAAHIFRNCELALDAGFTTVRDVGGLDGGVAEAIELGLVRGPRVLPSGALLSQTGGHGDQSPPYSPLHHSRHVAIPGLVTVTVTCDGPDEVRVAARNAFRRGATQLKVCVSGGVISLTDRLEDTQFTVEELMAAVAEADSRESYVTAHAHNSQGIRIGLEAGIRCFEHGTSIDAETAEAMAAAGAFLVPTFAVIRLMRDEWQSWGLPESVVPKIEGMEDAMAASMRLARACGVAIGSGSDILGGEQNRRGLELTLRAALETPMDAVVSATATNARILRRDRDIGTIEPGKLADLIAIDGDPLADPTVFDDPSRVVFVMKGGEVVKDTR